MKAYHQRNQRIVNKMFRHCADNNQGNPRNLWSKRKFEMKKEYKYPSIEVLNVDVMNHLLQASSSTPPNEIPDYDDWLEGKRSNSLWQEEEDEE